MVFCCDKALVEIDTMDVACINRDSVDDEAPVMLQFLMKLTWISIRVFHEDTKFTILALLLPPAKKSLGWSCFHKCVSRILSTISGDHRNTYGLQAGSTHPTGMLSCSHIFAVFFFICTI